jgi:hypothetical protein
MRTRKIALMVSKSWIVCIEKTNPTSLDGTPRCQFHGSSTRKRSEIYRGKKGERMRHRNLQADRSRPHTMAKFHDFVCVCAVYFLEPYRGLAKSKLAGLDGTTICQLHRSSIQNRAENSRGQKNVEWEDCKLSGVDSRQWQS